MSEEQVIALAEATKDELAALKSLLRKKYPKASQQVAKKELKAEAKRIAVQWLTKVAQSHLVVKSLDEQSFADLSVEFQRLHSAGEKSATRSTYDSIFKEIGKSLTGNLVLALKTEVAKPSTSIPLLTRAVAPLIIADRIPTAFVGHSFEVNDNIIAKTVVELLDGIGVVAVTGEKPKAEKISDKVKDLIESQEIFIGIFTRRDKIQGRKEWTTTSWVLEEKAYAVAKKKRLIMLREDGVGSIGGIHGDHEYISFARDDIGPMLVKLVQVFDVRTSGLR
jgi:hypothetical protein